MAAPSSETLPPVAEQPAEPGGGSTPALPWRRLLSFAGLPMISLVGSVTVIPVIASVSGAEGWAAVALGQAIGAGVATVLQYGWGFVGPTAVVTMDTAARARLLWVSTLSRLVVAALLFPVAVTTAALLAPAGRGMLAGLTAAALGTGGMSAYWFFVGTGRPGRAARYETVPRLGVLLGAALTALVTGNPIWYPVVFLAGQLAAITWLTLRLSDISFSRATWGQAFDALRDQRAAAATDVVVASLMAVPTSVIAAVAPGALAVFAAGDRVQRLAQSGIQPLYNAFQGWVSEAPGTAVPSRMRLAVLATSCAGGIAGVAVAVGLPVADRLLFAGEIQVSHLVSSLFGAVLAVWAVNAAITFDVLAPAGRTQNIFWSTAVGGAVVVLGVLVAPRVLGAAGGAAVVLLSQLASLAVQAHAWRSLPAGGGPAPEPSAPLTGG